MICLSDQEIYDITHKRQHAAQARALRFMGITFKERPDGSLAVSKNHAAKLLGEPAIKMEGINRIEPNWDMVNA